ncbi:hypothetical protein AZE42_03340 [Rhizopogon vesiculosus]|uniref:WW domain-containing protein n=1 Tax=Rhizopogon vesiculosus TaxID=180088 RepID=A0A1J8Q5S6_9AGAM|nr:hypothetical protein AZE42_03340 [Rhizopogon vesiculosus]
MPSPSSPPLQSPAVASSGTNLQSQKFGPFTPSEVLRYDKSPSIKRINKWESIQPLTRDYSDIQDAGSWCARVHPEGALYFYDPTRHVYTDSNLQNLDRRCNMDSHVDELLVLATTNGLQLNDGGIELVVQLLRDQQSVLICGYYFVDHPKRLLFWVEKQSTEKLFVGVQGVEKLSHIKYAVEHQYWQA